MIALTVLSETKAALTLGWTPVVGATGYVFLVDGERLSNTWDATRSSVKFAKPDAGGHVYEVVVLNTLQDGKLEWPAVTPPPAPPSGWTVAAPGSTGQEVTTISHPAGAGVNAHSASDPMVYSDIVVVGGADQSFLVQPGAPGRTFQRIQSVLAVQDGKSVAGNNKHAFYVKAANITVLDYAATAAPQADGGLSVRFAGFLGQRVTLDGFQLPLCVFADDEVKGTVTWRQIRVNGARGGAVCYLDCDEAARMVYDIVVDQVDGVAPGAKFLAANPANFAGTVAITGCTLNGNPVTAADVQGVPASKLVIR